MTRLTRREYLVATGSAGLAGLAGCSGGGTSPTASGPEAGGNGTTAPRPAGSGNESASFPSLSAPAPAFRDWLPASGDLAGGFSVAQNFARYRSRKSALPASTYESGTTRARFGGYVGIEFDELHGRLSGLTTPLMVSVGSFAPEDVESRLQSMPYEQYTQDNDATYFRWPEARTNRFVGVAAEGVIHGYGPREAEDPAGRFVDLSGTLFATARGERPALHEQNEAFRRYTEAVGWPLVANARPPVPVRSGGVGVGNPIGRAVSEDVAESVRLNTARFRLDGAVVDHFWLRTESDAPVSPDSVAAAMKSSDVRESLAPEDGSVSVRRDGRIVEVAVRNPVSNAGGGVDPPLTTVTATL